MVEDSPIERTLLSALARKSGHEVVEARDAGSALAAAEAHPPDVILLDIHLPDMDGLTLLSQLRTEHPYVPVVVISASADPEQVEAALDLGAVNFMFKPFKAREVHFILNRLSRAFAEEEGLQDALDMIEERRTHLAAPGDPGAIPHVVTYLGHEIRHHYPRYRLPIPDIKLALYEAMANAVEHGNLEIDFHGKGEAMIDPGGLAELVKQRLQDPRLAARKVHVDVVYRANEVEYRVRDEGPGFDPTTFDKLGALADTDALHGRGLALIRFYMDEVEWSEDGTEIRMTRRLHRKTRDVGL